MIGGPSTLMGDTPHLRGCCRSQMKVNPGGGALRPARHLSPLLPTALPAGLGRPPSQVRQELSAQEPGSLVLCLLQGSAPAAVGQQPFPRGVVQGAPGGTDVLGQPWGGHSPCPRGQDGGRKGRA